MREQRTVLRFDQRSSGSDEGSRISTGSVYNHNANPEEKQMLALASGPTVE